MKIHPKITVEIILAAVEKDDYIGFCVSCGEETSGVEPDARNYICEHCGANQVFGAEELAIMLI